MRGALPATLALATLVLAGCLGAPGDPPEVVASFYPLAFLAGRVAGLDLRVETLVPAGVEPHDWEPTPRAVQRVEQAKVLLLNGAGFEPWAGPLAAAVAARGGVVVEATAGLALREAEEGDEEGHVAGEAEAPDPHAWLDPLLAAEMARGVLDAVRRADPGRAEAHERRAAALAGDLEALHRDFDRGLRDCRNRNILTTHAAFAYPAQRYNFTAWSIAGLGPEAEPSPARLAQVVELARRLNVSHVFFETLVSPRVAEAVAREVGAQTLVLNPVEGLTDEDRAAGRTYLDLQRDNLANLRLAMGCA